MSGYPIPPLGARDPLLREALSALIAKHGTFAEAARRVGATPAWLHYVWTGRNKSTRFDLFKAIAEEAGMKVVLVPLDAMESVGLR